MGAASVAATVWDSRVDCFRSRIFMFRKGAGSRWVALLALVGSLAGAWALQARETADSPAPSGQSSVVLAQLPVQAREVMAQIEQGGPFRYEKDGTVFFNRERLLPQEQRGYYREYTVPTPGLTHRGARRIVCGGRDTRRPDACYYTADHYASFRLIVR